ncbi:MAG: hypothetical protein PHZ03_00125 [Syntrophomonas sp.]|nr:hypothetical protein [Syntrophomonas sp.]
MRRLKSDKSIIADLPEKIEMKSYAILSKKQAALYMSLVKDLQRKLETSDGIERKGLVLASLMKFKQICNHPDQYLGQAAYLANESGKYAKPSMPKGNGLSCLPSLEKLPIIWLTFCKLCSTMRAWSCMVKPRWLNEKIL